MSAPEFHSLRSFLEQVAMTLYDGRPCSHEEGCHDHETCLAECSEPRLGGPCECSLGDCCDPVQMGFDETHDALYEIVAEARKLLGLSQL